jgi:hypothetical protein
MLLSLLLAVNACGVSWDPVAVLPVEVRAALPEARVLSPCRVASLPAPIRDQLSEMMGRKLVALAEPDQEWNGACLGSSDLPTRQLVAVAQSGSRFVVHYREGGYEILEPAVVLELDGGRVRTLWSGWCAAGKTATGEATRTCSASR